MVMMLFLCSFLDLGTARGSASWHTFDGDLNNSVTTLHLQVIVG